MNPINRLRDWWLARLLRRAAAELRRQGSAQIYLYTEFNTSLEFAEYLESSAERFDRGDTSDGQRLWHLFAPTCSWDDAGGSLAMGELIFRAVDRRFYPGRKRDEDISLTRQAMTIRDHLKFRLVGFSGSRVGYVVAVGSLLIVPAHSHVSCRASEAILKISIVAFFITFGLIVTTPRSTPRRFLPAVIAAVAVLAHSLWTH
jgi:hypothetical protein